MQFNKNIPGLPFNRLFRKIIAADLLTVNSAARNIAEAGRDLQGFAMVVYQASLS